MFFSARLEVSRADPVGCCRTNGMLSDGGVYLVLPNYLLRGPAGTRWTIEMRGSENGADRIGLMKRLW